MTKRHLDDDARTGRGEVARFFALRQGVDVGDEPPLNASGGDAPEVDRREINVRWLGASVLTGLTGGALIGASIYIALQGVVSFAEPPERADAVTPRPSAATGRAAAIRKGDKLVRQEMIVSAKQGFKATVAIRAGEREVIRVRQFVRLATNLSLTAGLYASDIPAYNPLRLFAEESGERYAEPLPEVSDAEVSVVRRDLATIALEATAPALTDGDVAALLEEERRIGAETGRRPTVPMAPQLMLSRTLGQTGGLDAALGYAPAPDSLFNSIEVRVVPENVTALGKLDLRAKESQLIEEQDAILKRGETLETVLRGLGATPEQIRSISAALGAPARIASLPEGQRMRILLAAGPGGRRTIVRVILFGERGIEGIAATNDRGVFVSVQPPKEEVARRTAPAVDEEEGEEDASGGARLYNSLYETALKNELPRQTIEELVRIFGYDVDFQRRVASGDNLELFYSLEEDGGSPEILFASLNVGGEPRRVYRFQGDDGSIEYFDEGGRSLKKFLIRKPLADGTMRSGFGMRRHPILGYSKMHTGVDWSNPIGTPIVASGNGTVLKAEWDSGYGRRIEIQHTNGYVTAYSHMSRFSRGVVPGTRVRQGSVIGFVGNTGLSTGPHLHYEVIVNGHFVDPMKIRLPRGRELDGRALAEFKRQREQVDGLLERASQSTRLAQQAELR